MARPGRGVFLTPGEIAASLKVSRATVYAFIERGELVAHRVGLSLRIEEGDLSAFLAGRSPGGGREP